MTTKLNTASLLLAQVTNHSAELNRLITVAPDGPVAGSLIGRAILATNMLANSFSVLELDQWQSFLEAFEGLLITYRDKNLPWDERIAQVTSEIIEKEDQFISNAGSTPPASLNDLVSADEVTAMLEELVELQSTASAVTPQPPAAHPAPPGPSATQHAMAAQPVREDDIALTTIEQERTLGGCMGQLSRNTQSLLGQWRATEWDLANLAPEEFEQIRRELFLTSFHALSIEQMITLKSGDQKTLKMESLSPIRSTIEDFARVLCLDIDRHVDISFQGEDNQIDASLLFPVVKVLQCMISDVLARCNDDYLHIEVAVEEMYGILRWTMRDNGSNFISDSQLDPDEYLAFYPRLKETCKVLSELRSLLWVEPDETHDARFAFTVPASREGGRFMVWGQGDERVAVHANQVSKLIPLRDADIKTGQHGDYLISSGNRVPVIRLGQVYTGARVDGDNVVVIGRLEKRIAFLVPADGKVTDGKWLRDAIPAWRGMDRGVAEIGRQKFPLVEANGLVNRYLHIVNTSPSEVSGGMGEQNPDLSQAQADMDKVDPIPPASETDDAQVLVVERSEVLGHAFSTILAQDGLTIRVVNQLDDAIDFCMRDAAPSLVISEFRLPSMAAKVLVERLRSEGKNIPVLVTTTHRGERAKLLVEKLGVAGYISKPLDAEDVLQRVGGFFSG